MRRLNITDGVLDRLGFSEYWDEHCDWGGRTLEFPDGVHFRIIESEENEDDSYGYGEKLYVAHSFSFAGFFAITPPVVNEGFELFFLHDMYECIEKCYPSALGYFDELCRKRSMGIYIDDFLNNRQHDILPS